MSSDQWELSEQITFFYIYKFCIACSNMNIIVGWICHFMHVYKAYNLQLFLSLYLDLQIECPVQMSNFLGYVLQCITVICQVMKSLIPRAEWWIFSQFYSWEGWKSTLGLKQQSYIKNYMSIWYIEFHLCVNQLTTISTQYTIDESIDCGDYSLQSSGEIYILKWKLAQP
jgi:hypothetical protein